LRKIVFILTIVILIYGCAVKKKSGKTTDSGAPDKESGIFSSILNQNLTSRSFFLERAEFKIRSGDGEKSGLGTVKFLMPDKFLISIKSNIGIEVARIYLKGDSVFINDRFNKRLYYGSTSFLKSKYGFTTSLLPVLLGDYVNDQKLDSNKIRCNDGRVSVSGNISDVKIEYLIDCQFGKSILTVPGKMRDESSLEIKYSGFFSSEGINVPGKIEIIEKQTNTTIEILIQKVIVPWNGVIDFIPGRQYDKIHLQ
jgi:hypothetical protein